MWRKVTIDYLNKYILVDRCTITFCFFKYEKYLMIIIAFFVDDYFEILDKK